ncbi:lysine-specific demethylase 8 [Exaiptasia diaphana]|uniref:JmjC domain-containing protein n=1 Tax=Exaiptasia diaphana TaxID=2652724 RepID=A0A913Y2M2_EXADI|nr:lysine-specific demethylase 8 [Exaiptasia diaphana]KXJ22797.1 Lysine-specific demethylase 8 [Exaiptasia diaphana]
MAAAGFLYNVVTVFILFHAFLNTSSADDDPTTWPGHMEPLGSKQPKISLETVDHWPSPQEFFSKYVSPIKPLFIKGGAKLSPAFGKWTDEYFMSKPESKSATIFAEQGKKENRTNPGQDVSFYDFVRTYKEKDIYMVNGVIPFLQKDVILPPPLLCDDVTEDMLVDTVMWFSSGGTKSVLHNDDVDNINCLFSGTKELLFIDYKKYNKKVKIDHRVGGYSGVDVDKVDFTKYPGLRDVTYYNVTMETGDCLFIPYKWFHQVRSYDRNIAVNVWWKHVSNFVPSQCSQTKTKDFPTLDKFQFSALSANGDSYSQQNEERGPEDLIEYFSNFLKSADKSKMSLEMFINHMKNDKVLMGRGKYEWNNQFSRVAQQLFGDVDMNKDGLFDESDVKQFDSNSKTLNEKLENHAAELEDLIEDQQEPNLNTKNEQPETRDEL